MPDGSSALHCFTVSSDEALAKVALNLSGDTLAMVADDPVHPKSLLIYTSSAAGWRCALVDCVDWSVPVLNFSVVDTSGDSIHKLPPVLSSRGGVFVCWKPARFLSFAVTFTDRAAMQQVLARPPPMSYPRLQGIDGMAAG